MTRMCEVIESDQWIGDNSLLEYYFIYGTIEQVGADALSKHSFERMWDLISGSRWERAFVQSNYNTQVSVDCTVCTQKWVCSKSFDYRYHATT